MPPKKNQSSVKDTTKSPKDQAKTHKQAAADASKDGAKDVPVAANKDTSGASKDTKDKQKRKKKPKDPKIAAVYSGSSFHSSPDASLLPRPAFASSPPQTRQVPQGSVPPVTVSPNISLPHRPPQGGSPGHPAMSPPAMYAPPMGHYGMPSHPMMYPPPHYSMMPMMYAPGPYGMPPIAPGPPMMPAPMPAYVPAPHPGEGAQKQSA